MNDCILTVDAGGTYFKYALAAGGELLAGSAGQLDARSGGGAVEIIEAYHALARAGATCAEAMGRRITGVRISTPGPFDFREGVGHMKHKFQAIAGLRIAPWFAEALPGVPVSFLHDSTAFLLGEARCGAGVGAKSPAGVMLGTGFGFACMREGEVLVDERQTPQIILWNAPFRGGIVEDFVSRRAIRALYQALADKTESPDVRELALAARAGDVCALETFCQTGRFLGEILAPVLHRLKSDLLIVGGQISRASDLLLPMAQALLPCPAVPAAHPEDAALYGAAQA